MAEEVEGEVDDRVWEDENFDPMSQDYNDPKFNSYQRGPASYLSPNLHTQHRRKEVEGQNYKLFVSNIPLGVKDGGFQNIFSNFGVVLRAHLVVAKSGTCKYGFIEYRTLREAQRAIYSVNNVPPLKLSVTFSLADEAKENRASLQFDSPITSVEDLPPTKSPSDRGGCEMVGRSRGRGQLTAPFKGIMPSTIISAYRSSSSHFVTPSHPSSNSHGCGWFSLPSSDPLLWSHYETLAFDKPVVTQDRRFVVSLGRGHALTDIIDESERYCSLKQDKQTVYSYASEGLVTPGSCCVCGEVASRICFNCSNLFCSKICLRNDPPNHIVDSRGSVICYNSSNEEGRNANRRGIFVKKLIFPPADFKELTSSNLQKDHRHPISNRNSHLLADSILINSSSQTKKEETKPDEGSGMVDSFGAGDKSDSSPLDSWSFTQVKINSVEAEGCYWVNRMSDLNCLFRILKDLSKHFEDPISQGHSLDKKSGPCAIFVDSFWHRGRVVSCSNNGDASVQLVDYGWMLSCPLAQLKILPKNLLRQPPLAFKIRMAKGTDVKFLTLNDPDEVSVRALHQDKDGCIVVEVEGDSLELLQNPLPFDCFTEVIIANVVKKGEYYVNPCILWEELREMTDILTLMAEKSKETVSQPTLNSVYIHLYQNVWSRAKVVETKPNLKIWYIDYGNHEIVVDSHLKKLPSSMSTLRFPPMAVKIKVQGEEGDLNNYLSSIKPSDKLTVWPISKEGEEFIVEVKRPRPNCHLSTSPSIQPSLIESSHLLSFVKADITFKLTLSSVLSANRFSAILNLNPAVPHWTFDKIDELLAAAYSLSNINIDKVKIGDMIGCIDDDKDCKRGFISSVLEDGSARVALVDQARVITASKFFTLSNQLLQAPQMAVSCSLISPASTLQVGSVLHCKSAILKGSQVECSIDGYSSAVVTAWKPRVEDVGLKTVSITSGSPVSLSAFYAPSDVYIQSLEPKHVNMLDNLLQDVAAYACKGKELGREPEVGEVVACLFRENGNFYRAQVYRKLGKVYSVIYLDYGNTSEVTSDLMKPLPDTLKMVPCCAVRVQLHELNEALLTKDAVHFLNSNASDKTLFLEWCEGEVSCVLKTREGISINGKLKEFTSPRWKRWFLEGTDPTNGEVFFGYDLKYLKWESGRKGKLLIARVLSEDSCLVLDIGDGVLDLTRKYFIPSYSEYCTSFVTPYLYKPRLREICLVYLHDEKNWFRAVCTALYDGTCWVVLVDFGTAGEAYFTDIRPMTYELMQYPSLLKKCNIVNATETLKLLGELKEGSVYDATIVDENFQGVISANIDQLSSLVDT